MSSALARKIEEGGGVAPSLLRSRAFWTGLEQRVSEWMTSVLDVPGEARVFERRMVASGAAGAGFERPMMFCLAPGSAGALRGLIVEDRFALMNAMRRLERSADDVSDVPSLLLRLLFEPAAAALCADLPGGPSSGDDCDQPATFLDAAATDAAMAEPQMSLLIGLTRKSEDAAIRMGLLYDAAALADQVNAAPLQEHGPTRGRDTLRACVQSTVIPMEAVLDQITLTVGAWSRLEPGDEFELPNADPDHLSVQTSTMSGAVEMGSGGLGVLRGARAIKLHSAVSQTFTREIADQ